MKKPALLTSAAMLASALVLGGCGASENTGGSAKATILRMTTPVPPGDDLAERCQSAMNTFNARAGGAYRMQIFPGGQLASMSESLDAIRTGAVEGGVIPLAAFTGTAPEFGLAELPFLYSSAEANAYAMAAMAAIYNDILFEKADQKSLGCIYTGSLNLISTKKPLKTLEDLKGLIVGCDNPSSANLIAALGGSGIVVDFSEDYSNLQKGVINAKTSALQYMLIAKLYEVARYCTVFHGLGSLYSININAEIYDAMPHDIRDILDEEMGSLAQELSRYYVTLSYDLADVLEAKGVRYYHLPPAERERWRSLVFPETLATLEKYGDMGERIKNVADEANAKYPYTELNRRHK